MNKTLKIILDMVISPNGYIARENGDEDWLPAAGWDEFVAQARHYNNIVLGRETYEQVTAKYVDQNFDSVDCAHKVIVTRDLAFVAPAGYTIVHSPEEAIAYIQVQQLDTLFLIGGGKLNASFAKQGLIDEIQLTVTPYILGKGRSFLHPDDFEFPLELIDHVELSQGRIRLRYRVQK